MKNPFFMRAATGDIQRQMIAERAPGEKGGIHGRIYDPRGKSHNDRNDKDPVLPFNKTASPISFIWFNVYGTYSSAPISGAAP